MSQESIDIYFAAKDLLAARDHDGFARLVHPRVKATVFNLPEPGPFVGRDALVARLEGLGIEFDEQRYSDVEVVADHDGWIVLACRGRYEALAAGLMSTPTSQSHSGCRTPS